MLPPNNLNPLGALVASFIQSEGGVKNGKLELNAPNGTKLTAHFGGDSKKGHLFWNISDTRLLE
ncbi:hypothetical protein [Anaerospora hongkongensis]|uniref:hypothetical protein n=1 Tax=Anaerospora hongkongensis TaxID=244830 RepID=UPI002FD8AEF4